MTPDPLSEELVATLVEELRDQVGVMRGELATLAAAPGRTESVDTLFRIAHTLKGASRAANVPAVEETCRDLEARLAQARSRTGPLDDEERDRIGVMVEDLALAAGRLGSISKPLGDGGEVETWALPTRVRVLAVEDSPTQATKLRSALGSGGYVVLEARSGGEALRRFASEAVDLVVSDVMMPGAVDGYELCRRLKRERPDIPVILLTSLADPLDVIRGLEVGADSFLTKPYAPEHLLARLELLLANRRERASVHDQTGVSVRFMDQRFVIESGREQILDLLVTTFEDAVRQNRQLLEREAELSTRTAELERALHELQGAQEELARKERLAVLGRLSGSVGHELRNPLGVMTNAVYFLKLILPDAPEQVAEYLGILRHQIMLAEKIVADLLDFARIKLPQRSVTTVQALVNEQIARVVVPQNVRLDVGLPPVLPGVDIDPIQIGQVLLNLVTNAIQAMEQAGGVLTVAAELREEGRVTLSVQDTGPGVAEDLRTMIFEPLFTTKARGIGLGLAVSRSLAESNGGSLRLGNQAGRGARFELDLPTTASPP